MAQGVILNPRDFALLRLLDVTALTASQIRKVSVTFDGDQFRDERRVRERMQAIGDAGLVRAWSATQSGGGLMHYYRLTPSGYRAIHPDEQTSAMRSAFAEISPSRFHHAMATADIIVHTLVACKQRNIQVQRILGDGQLTLHIGEFRQQPDFHLQLESSGRTFNLVYEIDNATEPLDSQREQSIRTKILGYETYQSWALRMWHEGGRNGFRPAFRVVILTKGMDRANHILWLANNLAQDKRRRLILATTQDVFLAEPLAVTEPILNNHHGQWNALVDSQPTSRYLREPIRLSAPVAQARAF
jgi:hypothetical protein